MHKIGVILPVYKGDKKDYLEQAIDSILQQTYQNFIIFIGVDGPVPENIRSYLRSLEMCSQIQIMWFSDNCGLASRANELIEKARLLGCDYYARMDADDISLPERFEKQVNFLKAHPAIDVVGCAISEIDENGHSRHKIIMYPQSHVECRKFFARRNPHAHPAVMFRHSYFEKAGCMYRSEYRRNQDTMLWFDGMMTGTQHANLPDVLLKYRITNEMFKRRRNGWAFAKKQFADRLRINRGLGYGVGADFFGFAMFCMLVSPSWVKKIAYRVFR